MNEYVNLLDQYKERQRDHDEGDLLKLFFGVLFHFNNNCDISETYKNQMEDFFAYRWKHSKNLAF